MLKTVDNDLVEALAQTMETIAFLSLAPTDDRSTPRDAMRCTIDFTGVMNGRFCMVAPQSLGCCLAANVLDVDLLDPLAQEKAADSLRELMNVACGTYCSMQQPTGNVELGLPQAIDLTNDDDWESAVSNPAAQVFDVDGHTIAIWLEELT